MTTTLRSSSNTPQACPRCGSSRIARSPLWSLAIIAVTVEIVAFIAWRVILRRRGR